MAWATGYLTAPVSGVAQRDTFTNDAAYTPINWDTARNYFYTALISPTTADRETNFAGTFKSLGHVLHLVQDMGVPPHVRDDFAGSHFSFVGTSSWNPTQWVANLFEYYVKNNPASISLPPIYPTFTDVKLTDFWDTNQYTGNNPSGGTNQGLAEYTNANFVSDSTIFKKFPYPSKETSVLKVDYDYPDPFVPGSTIKRQYYKKIADGETNGSTGYRVAGVDYLWHYRQLVGEPGRSDAEAVVLPPMDDFVHADYAGLILPRAVGYSAALLDYFFRGSIELTLPVPSNERFSFIRLMARNNSSSGEEMTDPDAITLVVRYRMMKEEPTQGKLVKLDDEYHYIVAPLKNSVDRIPRGTTEDPPVELQFDLSASPIPLWAYDMTLQVVFRGQLGNEAGAVAVGMVGLPSLEGDIQVALPDKGIYGITAPDGSFSEFRLKAANLVSGGAAMTDGAIELVLWYKQADQDPLQGEPTGKSPADPEFYYQRVPVANGVRALPGGSSTELLFDLSQKPLPLWATDLRLYVVYTGRIGDNSGQIAVGFRDIAEPTPIDIINNMDHVCVNGSYLLAGSPEAVAAVGTDLSGRPKQDIYPHRLKNVYLSFTSTPASALGYSAKIPVIEPGRYGRLFVLTDYSYNVSSSETVENVYGPLQDVWGIGFGSPIYSEDGLPNQTVYENGEYVDYYPWMYSERGIKSWWYIHYENPVWPAGSTCDSSEAQPDLAGPVPVEIPR